MCLAQGHSAVAQVRLEPVTPTGLKIALVRSYLRVPKAAGQVKILIFLVKISFLPYFPIIFVVQGKCLF